MATNNGSIQNEETRFDGNIEQNETAINPVSSNEPASANKFKESAKSVISGAGGVAAGLGGSMLFMGLKEPDEPVENPDPSPSPIPTPEPAAFDGSTVPIADGVTDNMSFNQAFAAARREVGAGGVFEWRGGVYGTYYADEWKNFSPEYRQSFSNYHYDIEHEQQPVTPNPTPGVISGGESATINVNVNINVADGTGEGTGEGHDVTVINELAGQKIDIVSTVIEGQDVSFIDTNLDGNYDVVVINESPGSDLSVFPFEEGFTIDDINEIKTAYSGTAENSVGNVTTYNVNYDPSNDIADFNNDADISSLA